MKVSSIKNYLGVISLLHKEFGLNSPLADNWPLKPLLLGIKRVKGGEVAQKLPITPNILSGIYSKLNMVHSFDASFWAICLTAFYGMFRKSHLVPTSAANFDFCKQFTNRDVTFFSCGGHCSKSAGAKRSNSGKGLSRCPSPLSPGPPFVLVWH